MPSDEVTGVGLDLVITGQAAVGTKVQKIISNHQPPCVVDVALGTYDNLTGANFCTDDLPWPWHQSLSDCSQRDPC